ncbi:MAG: TiaS agmantine-binding domain-containing protein [Candidatus Bathyarchaeales archaeon]
MVYLHIGIDDTDSPRKSCTTYVAALLVEKLRRLSVKFSDYPNLVRLNPNVPWKTRGNGALCLRVECDESLVGKIKETVIEAVEEHSDFEYAGTEPGIVFLERKTVPREIRTFAKNTIQGIVKLSEALRLIRKVGAEAVGYKTGRGVVGALAAIGENLQKDHTYELITYRYPENRGTKRRVDVASVKEMNEKTSPLTFNNIDPENSRTLITPRGPDPILFGIRGETPEVVKQAFSMVRAEEPIERWVIFRTNHGTDAHLWKIKSLGDVQPYRPVIVRGTVADAPKNIPRRHVIFSIKDNVAKVDCAAYEPTGALRKAAKQLIPGDIVEVYGGVRPASKTHPITINLEKFRVIKLAPKVILHNPKCPKCGKTMSSMGKAQGFRCGKCGYKSKQLTKTRTIEKRTLEKRLYITSPHSQRHLTKPFSRYGQEKTFEPSEFKMIREWHHP